MTDGLQTIDDRPPDLPFLEYRNMVGRGGTATVWRAWHRTLRRDVAVKVLFDSLAHNPDDVDQFITEGRTMAYMDHPSIVHGYGVEQIDAQTRAPDPRLFVPTLSQGFVNLLACMLVKDRDRRFYDWSAVIDACQCVEEGECLACPSAVSSVNLEQL